MAHRIDMCARHDDAAECAEPKTFAVFRGCECQGPSSALRAPSPRGRGEGELLALLPLAPPQRGEGGPFGFAQGKLRPGEGHVPEGGGATSSHRELARLDDLA